MEGIINLHHDLMFIMTAVGVFTLYIMIRVVQIFGEDAEHNTLAFRQIYNLPDKTVHGTALEIGWTTAPAIIWELNSVDNVNFSLVTSENWINNEDVIASEFESVLEEIEEED